MRRRKTGGTQQADVNLTPMLDIVFILLIFFIVTATFLREKGLDLTPPPPSPPDAKTETVPTILIFVDQDSTIRINGELTDLVAVRAKIERLSAETPNIGCLVQAHPQARNGIVVGIVDQAKSAGVKVSLTGSAT